MEWMFLIAAYNRPRVESRILQVLDHHMVPLQSFASMRVGDEIRVTFVAETDAAAAGRARELLNKLQDVQTVDAFATKDGMCRTLALFKILCDHESRLPLLQVIASLGAQVVAMRPDFLAFQIVGTPQEIEGVHASLLSYGLVEGVSVALAAVRSRAPSDAIKSFRAPESASPELPMKSSRAKAGQLPRVELRRAAV